MAEVYEDFDKRTEHQRRFHELTGAKELPAYSAPTKPGRRGAIDEFAPALQRALTEDLLNIKPGR